MADQQRRRTLTKRWLNLSFSKRDKDTLMEAMHSMQGSRMSKGNIRNEQATLSEGENSAAESQIVDAWIEIVTRTSRICRKRIHEVWLDQLLRPTHLYTGHQFRKAPEEFSCFEEVGNLLDDSKIR